MQPRNSSNKFNQPRPLSGFASIPLLPADLLPFGGEVGTSGHALWALHRDAAGRVTGRETVYGAPRNGYGFTPGGRKGLFRSTGNNHCRPRLVLVDGPIQAIARAALDDSAAAAGTTYAAPGGPWTQAAGEALEAMLRVALPEVVTVAFASARDGCCHSAELCRAILAHFPAVAIETLTPPTGGWVEVLRASRRILVAA